MRSYPPLPTEFGGNELRVRWEKWRHWTEKKRINFTDGCVKHLIGYKRRIGLLPKKPR